MCHYAEHLAANPTGAESICLIGYEQELAELPGAYAAPDGGVFAAFREGLSMGCVAVKPIRRENERACEMKRLWVEPAARGTGLGKRLVEIAVQWARSVGYSAMYLDTVPAAMPEARKLYTAMGFVESSRYNDNELPGIVFMRLAL